MNFVVSIIFLLFSTALFCWLFTSNWGLGPVCHLAFFLGGFLFLGLVGVASLRFFHPQP